MDEFGLSSLFMWSIVTGIAMLVVGFSYRMYLQRHDGEIKDKSDVDAATASAAHIPAPHTPTTDIPNDGYASETLNTDQSQLSSDTLNQSSPDATSETSLDTSSDIQNNSSVADDDNASCNLSVNHNTDDAKTTTTKSEHIDG